MGRFYVRKKYVKRPKLCNVYINLPTMLASSVQAVVAGNVTVLRVRTLVLFN